MLPSASRHLIQHLDSQLSIPLLACWMAHLQTVSAGLASYINPLVVAAGLVVVEVADRALADSYNSVA